MKVNGNFLFFWGSSEYMSNWYKSTFVVDGITFNCSEQYMMYHKAILFGDTETANNILNTLSQSKQKALGREVKNYDDDIWYNNRLQIVFDGCLEKFRQNDSIRKQLIRTENLHLVEASPYDRIWGIGLDENHQDASNPDLWRGLNLLGEVLMKVRDVLINENNNTESNNN